jgi:hypothetical protein
MGRSPAATAGGDRVPGAMQHAASRGVMRRRTGTVPSAGVRDGPGSAVHRSASATRCTASGTRVRFQHAPTSLCLRLASAPALDAP